MSLATTPSTSSAKSWPDAANRSRATARPQASASSSSRPIAQRQAWVTAHDSACALPPEPGAVAYTDADCDAYAKLMIDLVVMALRCDLTRVALVSLGPSQNYRTFPHLDVPYTYHNVCHSGGGGGGSHSATSRT